MASAEQNQGQQRLGLFDAASIIVSIVIGTTIFELPGAILGGTKNPWMAIAVWVCGGFLSLVGGLCYAELATTYPRDGGDYYYLTRAFGRWVGFLFGWAQLIIVLPASIGGMAYVFASQASEMYKLDMIDTHLNLGLNGEFYYAALAIIVIALLNLFGIILGRIALNLLSLAKIAGLITILVCGFLNMKPELSDWSAPQGMMDTLGWQSFAIILVMYAFGGWNDAAFVAAEVRNRKRNIPVALLLGIGVITVIYVLVNLAFMLGLGFEGAKSTKESLHVALLRLSFGDEAVPAMRVIVMVSALGAINALTFAGARVYATLGNDHRLFGFLGHWMPGRGSPILALLAQALITVGFVFLFATAKGHGAINDGLDWFNTHATEFVQKIKDDAVVQIDYPKEWNPGQAFGAMVTHSAPAFWFFFLLAGFSLFVLRQQNPHIERPFSVPFYPLVPIIFCNSCAYMLYQSTIYIGWRTLFVVGLLLAGIPLYWLSQLLGTPAGARERTS